MTCKNNVTLWSARSRITKVIIGCGSFGQQVRHINVETINATNLAVTEDRLGVTSNIGLSKFRRHQCLTLSRSDNQITISLRNVLLIQHRAHSCNCCQNSINSGCQINWASISTKGVARAQSTSSCANVGSISTITRAHDVQKTFTVNSNFHLIGSISCKDVHQIRLSLELKNVRNVYTKVKTLINLKFD